MFPVPAEEQQLVLGKQTHSLTDSCSSAEKDFFLLCVHAKAEASKYHITGLLNQNMICYKLTLIVLLTVQLAHSVRHKCCVKGKK